MHTFLNAQLIVFDLDDTLTVSKTPMDKEMVVLFKLLLARKKVAVVSGGMWEQMRMQVCGELMCTPKYYKNLSFFPTCGASFYQFHKNDWCSVYKKYISKNEKQKIVRVLTSATKKFHIKIPPKKYGKQIEDRNAQITLSALGQKAPVHIKRTWDPDGEKRKKIIAHITPDIPGYEVRIGGTTSIDVTKKGIDKAYAISQMETHLKVPKEKMLFVGDKLYEGGNDYPVKEAGVRCIAVGNQEDTKKLLRSWLSY